MFRFHTSSTKITEAILYISALADRRVFVTSLYSELPRQAFCTLLLQSAVLLVS